MLKVLRTMLVLCTALLLFTPQAGASELRGPVFSGLQLGMGDDAALSAGQQLGYHVYLYKLETDNGEPAEKNSAAFIRPDDKKTLRAVRRNDENVIYQLDSSCDISIWNDFFGENRQCISVRRSAIAKVFGMDSAQPDFVAAFTRKYGLPPARKAPYGRGFVTTDRRMGIKVEFGMAGKKVKEIRISYP